MEIVKALDSISSSYPILVLLAVLLIALVPKTFDYLTKKTAMHIETTDSILDKITKRASTLQDRCELLEKELDMWKERFYALKNELADLEVDNKRLQAEIEDLKAARSS